MWQKIRIIVRISVFVKPEFTLVWFKHAIVDIDFANVYDNITLDDLSSFNLPFVLIIA
jgi:hypothetical protein